MQPPLPTALPLSRWRRSCAAMLLAMTVSACTTAPPAAPQLDFHLPERFTQGTSNDHWSPAGRWWESLGDAQLNALVEQALSGNPSIAQSLAQQRMAAAQARISAADRLPQVSLGAGSARQRQSLPGLDGSPTPVIGNNHSLTLDISWELDLWGRLSAQSAAAQAQWLASSEQLRAVRQSIAAQVARLYLQTVHARAQLELSQRTVQTLSEIARQINNRVHVGIASPADGQLASANLESARAGMHQRQEALEQQLRQLQTLMGQYPTGQLATAKHLPEVPSTPASGVPAQLLARRPDVRAAELQLLAAGYRLQAAERSFLPALSLSGSAGFSAAQLADLLSSSHLIWSIAGRVLQPIFQGGRLRAQVQATDAQRDEALGLYAETALNALLEVETALAIDHVLLQREMALQHSATAAEEAMRISYNRYRQGIDPFLNVLESQQRALDGRSAQISARQARLDNRLALHLALGGGFDAPAPPSTPAAHP